jgi:hypothetical protein
LIVWVVATRKAVSPEKDWLAKLWDATLRLAHWLMGERGRRCRAGGGGGGGGLREHKAAPTVALDLAAAVCAGAGSVAALVCRAPAPPC